MQRAFVQAPTARAAVAPRARLAVSRVAKTGVEVRVQRKSTDLPGGWSGSPRPPPQIGGGFGLAGGAAPEALIRIILLYIDQL